MSGAILIDDDLNVLVDDEGNTLVAADVRYWIAASLKLSDDDTQWSETSGGANDTTAPDSGASPIFDVGGVGDCTWNISLVLSLDMLSGYPGVITLDNDFTVDDHLDINGAAGSQFITDGNNLDVLGDFISEGDTDGLIHNVGGVVRFGAGLHLDKGDVDSDIEYVDFVGGPLVVHDTFVSVGSTQLPSVFIVRSNNQMSIVAGTTLMNLTLETNASLTDNGSIKSVSFRGDLIITDLVGSILSTLPGRLNLQFNALTAPGGDYGTASFRVTSSLINIQGDVVNVHEAIIARTFPTDAATLDMTLGDFSCEILQIGSLTNDAINGDILVPSGRRLVANISCELGATDGVILTVLEFADGALLPILGSIVVRAKAKIEFNNNNYNLQIPGDVIIDSDVATIANFGLTLVDLTGSGDLKNETPANAFYSLSAAASGKVTTCIEAVEVVGGVLSFKGGTYDFGIFNTAIEGQGAQLAGALATTFLGTGSFALSLVADMAIEGGMYPSGINFTINTTNAGAKTLEFSGAFSCGSFFLATASDRLITLDQLDTCTLGFFNHGFTTDSAIWKLNGNTLTVGVWRYNGPNNQIVGPGTVDCTAMTHDQGTMDLQDILANNSGDHNIALGATLDLKNGKIITLGDFVPLGQVNFDSGTYIVEGDIDLSSASGISANGATIISRGANDRIIKLAGLTNYNLIIDNSAGGIARLQQAPTCGSGFFREVAKGNGTIEHLNAGAASCDHIETIGVGGAKNSNISSGAGTYQITVLNLGPINRYSGWADCNIVGAFIRVDLLTGSDDGGNDVTGPDGIDFGNFATGFIGLVKTVKKLGNGAVTGLIRRARALIGS